MSSFEVKVRRVTVSEHPNADLLSLGEIDGYKVVVGKDNFRSGDLAVYIPESAVVPDNIIAEMGLEGRLAGAEKNRVKAIKLRGELSQGLLYRPDPWPDHWVEGYDVGEEIGIVKWEPTIPSSLAGKVRRLEPGPGQTKFSGTFLRTYDVENIKHFPNVLVEGERVIICEKLHGSATICGTDGGTLFVSSKGIAKRELCLEEEAINVYWKIVRQLGLLEKIEQMRTDWQEPGLTLYGEVLGVQDLMYGLKPGQLSYCAFDLLTSNGFLNYDDFLPAMQAYGIPTVPVLYDGPYSAEVVQKYTDGKSTVKGAEHQIREGIVIRAEPRRHNSECGRVVLKSVSAAYLLRKGNTTELE